MATIICTQDQDYITTENNQFIVRSQLQLLNAGVVTPENIFWVPAQEGDQGAYAMHVQPDLRVSIYYKDAFIFNGTWAEYLAVPMCQWGYFNCGDC